MRRTSRCQRRLPRRALSNPLRLGREFDLKTASEFNLETASEFNLEAASGGGRVPSEEPRGRRAAFSIMETAPVPPGAAHPVEQREGA